MYWLRTYDTISGFWIQNRFKGGDSVHPSSTVFWELHARLVGHLRNGTIMGVYGGMIGHEGK
jgi:hypothetical protein